MAISKLSIKELNTEDGLNKLITEKDEQMTSIAYDWIWRKSEARQHVYKNLY